MEYRFSLTPRLIALAIFSGVAMLVLLFALGYEVGKSMNPNAENALNRAASNAAERKRQELEGKIGNDAAAAAAPVTDRAAAVQKATQ